jgi:hypothetical protein
LESGFWRLKDNGYVVEHHANVVRQSIAAQVKHREKERDRQQQKRRNARGSGDGALDTDVGTNVTTNVAATQPVSQTESDEVSAHVRASDDDGRSLLADRCSEFLGVDGWCWALVAGTVEGRPFCATHIAEKKAPT